MKELKRGFIVAISSASTFFPIVYNAEYTSTKFAIRGLMRSLRQTLKFEHFHNIHTTTACPSFLQTHADVAHIIRQTKSDSFYPLISGEDAAKSIIVAMLRNQEEICLPDFLSLLYRCNETLPASWQDVFNNKMLNHSFASMWHSTALQRDK